MKTIEKKEPHGFCVTPNSTCNMNYCDDNGCVDRKRALVNPADLKEISCGVGKHSWVTDYSCSLNMQKCTACGDHRLIPA